MFIDNCIKNDRKNIQSLTRCDEYELHRVRHDSIYGVSYFFINKMEEDLSVKLDVTKSENCYFSPTGGVFECPIGPGVMRYLCSAIADPEEKQLVFKYKLEVRNPNGKIVKPHYSYKYEDSSQEAENDERSDSDGPQDESYDEDVSS
uniref:Uncharacterized protein n=1 Tax=Euplotes harpa TaxID=151035 RepID=A0A7S3J0A2_9SPIT|mmetsp:Transcript_12272/g.14018  ORF Transcript_12272/g.14018 Transcript_12272/m.14018 type:complete len:147 (+) Transcript_12272:244-684(+)